MAGEIILAGKTYRPRHQGWLNRKVFAPLQRFNNNYPKTNAGIRIALGVLATAASCAAVGEAVDWAPHINGLIAISSAGAAGGAAWLGADHFVSTHARLAGTVEDKNNILNGVNETAVEAQTLRTNEEALKQRIQELKELDTMKQSKLDAKDEELKQKDRVIKAMTHSVQVVKSQGNRDLGGGAMGFVREVFNAKLGKTVARKTIHSEYKDHPVINARLEKEITTLMKFRHPNVVSILDRGIDELGRPYFDMPLLEGRTLAKVLEISGTFSMEKAAYITTQILDGEEALHGEDIVHRDIKPSNIFVDNHGRVKILDFGLVTEEVDLALHNKITMDGEAVGTPNYMSPEQFSGRSVGHKTDIYSTGIVLYELLAGRVPFAFSFSNLGEFAREVQSMEPNFDEIPQEARPILKDMLAKNPSQRPKIATIRASLLPFLNPADRARALSSDTLSPDES